jgi:hypothetical protein
MQPVVIKLTHSPFKWEKNVEIKKLKLTLEYDCIKYHRVFERDEWEDKEDEKSAWVHRSYNWRITHRREAFKTVDIVFIDKYKTADEPKWQILLEFMGGGESIQIYFDDDKGLEAYDVFVNIEKYLLNRPE